MARVWFRKLRGVLNAPICHKPSFFSLSLQIRHRMAASTGWVSLHDHLGAVLVSASVDSVSLVHTPSKKEALLSFFFYVFTHLCLFCFIPLPYHHVFLSNCHPFSGAGWPSRHQQVHLWSKCINVNILFVGISFILLLFIYYARFIFNQASVLPNSPILYKCVNTICIENTY